MTDEQDGPRLVRDHPHLPLDDVVCWKTRELVHHASDLMTVRDLDAVTHPRP